MKKSSRIRVYYISLLFLLTLLTVYSTLNALRISSRHKHATEILAGSGMDLWDDFTDPLGPNWLFNKKGWPKYFCTEGWYWCEVHNLKPSAEVWSELANLIDLQNIVVCRSIPPNGWIEVLSKCKDLKRIEICDTPLTLLDIRQLSKLKVKRLLFYEVDVSTGKKEFIDSIVSLNRLDILSLDEIVGLSTTDIEYIRTQLPSTRVNSPMSNAPETSHSHGE